MSTDIQTPLTDSQLQARYEKLSKVHPKEIGGRVSDVCALLSEIIGLRSENARLTALVTELSTDWSTPEKILEHKKLVGEVARLAEKLAEVEGRCAGLAKERDEVTAAFQKECDHEWQHEDDSFDHEFGTEQLHSSVCEKCGLSKPEPETFGDEAI